MKKKFEEIEDLKLKRRKLFEEAENYRKNGKFDEAITRYDEFLEIGERVKDYSRHYDGYLGMYLAWANCVKCGIDVLNDLCDMVLLYAPDEADNKDVWVNNFDEDKKEVSNE